MTENIGTNERVLRSDVTMEECEKIERVLQRNNISYYEKWDNHKGLLGIFGNKRSSRCDIYVHKDSLELAEKAIEDNTNKSN